MSTDKTDPHLTHVVSRWGRYVAVCDVCGQVGQPQEYAGDAQAIADRHEEIGGCER